MPTPRHYPLHLIIVPIMELALILAIAAYITTIDMNLLYLLSIPLGAILNDESSYVREAVARQKYRLDVLMYDDDEDVRAVVAELGYGLDELIKDKSEFVRLTAQEKLNSTT